MRCAATRERVESGSALYNNYCHNYESGYSRCPHFKGEPTDNGGCYLTSACVEAMGLADDCNELTVLRGFRDSWLAKQPGGRETIDEYYRIAPPIVDAIHAAPNCAEVLRELYEAMIVPCVREIRAGKMESARELYAGWTRKLKKEWIEEAKEK
ncbi:MAG: hypothetical protein IJ466_07980 [Clostridia bacterium]|nr:hypothetical protein [Clostridia bacterium]